MPQARILVVDDEPDIRHLVSEILADEGYTVSVAKDGESARLAYANEKPDLVLLDIWMPDIDGITLLKEWSSGGSLACPVVAPEEVDPASLQHVGLLPGAPVLQP